MGEGGNLSLTLNTTWQMREVGQDFSFSHPQSQLIPAPWGQLYCAAQAKCRIPLSQVLHLVREPASSPTLVSRGQFSRPQQVLRWGVRGGCSLPAKPLHDRNVDRKKELSHAHTLGLANLLLASGFFCSTECFYTSLCTYQQSAPL